MGTVPPRQYVQTDASHNQKLGLAAIAGCTPDRLMFAKVVPAESVNVAEREALLQAMRIAAARQVSVATFHCDNEGVVRKILNGKRTGLESVLEIRSYLESPPLAGHWVLRHVPRRETKRADRACRGAWRKWGRTC